MHDAKNGATRLGRLEADNPGPARVRGRPTREHASARQAELLDVALDMFLDSGFEQTTIEAVATAVGMTKRTVYAKFPDKAALFRATVARAVERETVPQAELEQLDNGDLAATLTAVALRRVAFVTTPQGLKLQRIIAAESYRFPDIFTYAYTHATMPVIAFIAGLLGRDPNVGPLVVEDPEAAARLFMSMVVGGPVRIIVSGNPLTQHEIDSRVDFAVRLFLDGARRREE